jgi:6-phosphogluconolactonase
MKLNQFLNVDELNYHFAQHIASLLTQAINLRGHAYLTVPGGNTPQTLFNTLAHTNIAWQNVTITLTDERDLLPTAIESNEYLLKSYLLQQHAAKANFISLYSNKASLQDRLKDIEQRFSLLPIFDIVILGMGLDGHTASLFPCSPQIKPALSDNNKKNILTITPKSAPYSRFSLSKNRLLNTRSLFLYIVGEPKLIVLQEATQNNDPLAMPIRAFINHINPEMEVMFSP